MDVTGRVLTFHPRCKLSGLETFDRVEVQEAPSHTIVDIYIRVDTANGAPCPHVTPWGPIVVELVAPLGPLGAFQSSDPLPPIGPPPADPG